MSISKAGNLILPPHPDMPLETAYRNLEHGLNYHVMKSTTYKVGNSTIRVQSSLLVVFFLFVIGSLFVLYMTVGQRNSGYMLDDSYGGYKKYYKTVSSPSDGLMQKVLYESPYPLSPPVRTDQGLKYKVAIIADLDTSSVSKDDKYKWISYLKSGFLTINTAEKKAYLAMDSGVPITLSSNIASGGRGMELSELVVFDGNVVTFDDRTGIVYIIEGTTAYPWVILTDGPGKVGKGFKSEWATVKDGYLYVGGLGKVWTNSKGELVNHFPQWVKSISPKGHVKHHDWQKNYEALAKAVGIEHPGYLIHEACAWSETGRKWIFLPRRESKESYDENKDEDRGSNLMLIADEDFTDIQVKRIGDVVPTHGFSSFKFIPGTRDQWIIALKSEEADGKTSTYAMVFTMEGEIILPETQVSSEHKFEGIEFL